MEYNLIENAEGKVFTAVRMNRTTLCFNEGALYPQRGAGEIFRAMSWYGLVPMPFYDGAKRLMRNRPEGHLVTAISKAGRPPATASRSGKIFTAIHQLFVGESDDRVPTRLPWP